MTGNSTGQSGAAGTQRFGQYQLKTLIDQGDYASLYRASCQEPDKLGRPATVLVLRRHLSKADDPRWDSFLTMARSAAAGAHPHLLSYLECGRVGRRLFLAVEPISGPNLAQVLKVNSSLTEPLTEDVILPVALQLAQGLEALHAAPGGGADVHGDLKPSNIFLFPDGTTKIVNHGVSSFAAEFDRSSGATSSRVSLAYQAPEQIRGEGATKATDVFAYGIAILELILAEQVFADDSEEEVRRKVLQVDLGPSLMGARFHFPELVSVLEHCLVPDPTHRAKDGAALVKALSAIRPPPVRASIFKELCEEAVELYAPYLHAGGMFSRAWEAMPADDVDQMSVKLAATPVAPYTKPSAPTPGVSAADLPRVSAGLAALDLPSPESMELGAGLTGELQTETGDLHVDDLEDDEESAQTDEFRAVGARPPAATRPQETTEPLSGSVGLSEELEDEEDELEEVEDYDEDSEDEEESEYEDDSEDEEDSEDEASESGGGSSYAEERSWSARKSFDEDEQVEEGSWDQDLEYAPPKKRSKLLWIGLAVIPLLALVVCGGGALVMGWMASSDKKPDVAEPEQAEPVTAEPTEPVTEAVETDGVAEEEPVTEAEEETPTEPETEEEARERLLREEQERREWEERRKEREAAKELEAKEEEPVEEETTPEPETPGAWGGGAGNTVLDPVVIPPPPVAELATLDHTPIIQSRRGRKIRVKATIIPGSSCPAKLGYRAAPMGNWLSQSAKTDANGVLNSWIPAGSWQDQATGGVQYYIEVRCPEGTVRSGSAGAPHLLTLF